MQDILSALRKRGFVDQVTSDVLEEHLKASRKVYVGFDPTADSLHLGNLMGIMALAWFEKYGHTPIVILGGATGLIGDPSGRSSERNLLDEKTLNYNVQRLSAFFQKILPSSTILNNRDWLGKMSLIQFLRDIGKQFRMGSMLAKESVRARVGSEEGMSFTEFSYQCLQGYDFHYLYQHHGVSLQMGGSDQWGNITAGIEYHRKQGGQPIFGLTFPLITRSDGKKFGKSESGAIWLEEDKLSPYQLYQYLFALPDADVIRLLKVLTFLDLDEIESIERSMHGPGAVPNVAQRRLAEEVVRFVHGEIGLDSALRATESMAPGSEATLSGALLRERARDMPNASLARGEVIGKRFTEVASSAGIVASKSEATRLIQNGGAYLNNERITDTNFIIEENHLIDDQFILLGAGKKKKLLVTILS